MTKKKKGLFRRAIEQINTQTKLTYVKGDISSGTREYNVNINGGVLYVGITAIPLDTIASYELEEIDMGLSVMNRVVINYDHDDTLKTATFAGDNILKFYHLMQEYLPNKEYYGDIQD